MPGNRRIFRMQQTSISQSGSYYPEDVADITFINQGTSRVQIDTIVLQQGDSLSQPAFGDENNNTQYNITFLDSGTGITYNLLVMKKVYEK